MNVQEKISVSYVAIDSLIPAEYNPRKASVQQHKDLTNSMLKFGIKDPLIVNSADNRKNIIIGGHFRQRVAKDIGFTEVPVVFVNIPDIAKERELNIRLNRNLGEWDLDLLAQFDEDLLKEVGFDSAELDRIFQTENSDADDAVPTTPEIPKTKRGDIYQLGRHRLMCGDSTSVDDADKLMNGQKADMVFTDPPYGVDYEGYTKDKLKIEGDKKNNFLEVWDGAFKNYILSVKKGASFYICHASIFQTQCESILSSVGLEIRCQIIWVKNTFAWGFGRYKFQHEPIFYAHIKDQADAWYGDYSQSTVWEIKKPAANRLHPTMKPVELINRAIINSSKRDDLIIDLFLGSGSTLIACEKTNRICYGMEIDPKYCDVIVKRWEEFTKQKAVLLNGQT